jgi:protein-disulfide isomerase-like protein with CxxC motif
MENFKAFTEEYRKIKAANLTEEEWSDKLFQIRNLLQMIGKRDESIRRYQDIAAKNGLPESEFELAISNNLELRADFVNQITALFADFNVLVQPTLSEKIRGKTFEMPISQAA